MLTDQDVRRRARGEFIMLIEKYKATGAFNIKFITCSLNVGDHSKEESLTLLGEDTETLNLFAQFRPRFMKVLPTDRTRRSHPEVRLE